ncbi:MAG: energy-coupling factor transporter transmembrane component T family protein [Candidatus Methanomethylicaceae archaeon]
MPSVIKELSKGLEEILQIDRISSRQSNLSPISLVVISSLVTVSALLTTSLLSLLALGTLTITIALFTRVSLKKYLLKPTILASLVLLTSIPAAFMTEGAPIFTVMLGSIGVSLTVEGMYRIIQFTLRAWVCIASLTLLTTKLGIDGLLALLSQIRVPKIALQTISLVYRYLFISIHDSQRILLAREARRYRSKNSMNMEDLRDLGKILAALFIRTYERSERVYLAMKARGFSIERTRMTKIQSLKTYDLPLILTVILAIYLVFTKIL